MQKTVGISEMLVSKCSEDILVTYSLGSCIGLTLYDPTARVGGMVHCMLPLSKISPEKAADMPGMFTDTGVTLLIQRVLDAGAQKKRLIAKVAGAARVMDEARTFNIGERNRVVLRKVLWKNNILISAEDTGGTVARTFYLYMKTGVTVIKSLGIERELQ